MKEYRPSKQSVNVLGTDYQILYITEEEDKYLEECVGFCDRHAKYIVIKKQSEEFINSPRNTKNHLDWINQTLIHELIHAFLTESGVSYNNMDEENICDFLEVNLIKIYKAFEQCKFIEEETEEML